MRCIVCGDKYKSLQVNYHGECYECVLDRKSEKDAHCYLELLQFTNKSIRITEWLQDYDRRRKAGLV